jgi:hypothetical protein
MPSGPCCFCGEGVGTGTPAEAIAPAHEAAVETAVVTAEIAFATVGIAAGAAAGCFACAPAPALVAPVVVAPVAVAPVGPVVPVASALVVACFVSVLVAERRGAVVELEMGAGRTEVRGEGSWTTGYCCCCCCCPATRGSVEGCSVGWMGIRGSGGAYG